MTPDQITIAKKPPGDWLLLLQKYFVFEIGLSPKLPAVNVAEIIPPLISHIQVDADGKDL
jgi:hypothetical protein